MANNIKRLRLDLGMTQHELGSKFRKPKDITVVSRWERGVVKPSTENTLELARILKVAPNEIFNLELDRLVCHDGEVN